MSARGTVLIVDDEPQIRGLLAGVCRGLDLDVVQAQDGVVALDAVDAGHVDLMLLDLFLPRLDGLGVLRALRERGLRHPGVLVLTSATDPHSQLEATRLGAIDYVIKPFRINDISRRIERVLAIVELEHRLESAERQLEDLRERDGVTGVASAGTLFRALEQEFAEARKVDRSLACVVVSDEGYDRTLRQVGREAGEARLHTLARAIEGRRPISHRIFRIDAAEFVVLLPGGRDTAAEAVQEIRHQARALGWTNDEDLAVGVAVYPHPELSQASLFYRAANVSLAQARTRGCDCYFEGF